MHWSVRQYSLALLSLALMELSVATHQPIPHTEVEGLLALLGLAEAAAAAVRPQLSKTDSLCVPERGLLAAREAAVAVAAV